MIAHRKRNLLVLGMAILLSVCIAVPSFASSLDDASVTFSVKVSYTYNSVIPTLTSRTYITSEGHVVSTATSCWVTDPIDVFGYNWVFFYRTSDSAKNYIRYACFYDSDGNVIPGGFDGNLSGSSSSDRIMYLQVPSGASTVRLSQNYSSSIRVVPCYSDPSGTNYIYRDVEDVSIDSDGNVVIPYQTSGYTAVNVDFQFFDSTYRFQTMSFKTHLTYTGGYFSGVREWDGSTEGAIHLHQYYIDTSGVRHNFDIDTSLENPHTWNEELVSNVFSGFTLVIPFSSVSTSLNVNLTDFILDGEDVAAEFKVAGALDDLNDLADQIALPTPDSAALFDGVSLVINNVNDNNARGFMRSILTDDGIVTTMMVISITICVLGYILFGKKDA